MTGRLISADRLKRSFEANTPIAFQDCVPGIHSVIDLEPTVDAIPVEWLEEYATNLANKEKANSYAFRGYKDGALWIRSMIRAWREECRGE